jgi:serine/threonine protein phosphatase PrpC
MKLIAAGMTNVGMKRSHNEDSHLLVPEENLFIVADGMGGHACGEVASQMAVHSCAEFFRMTSSDDEQTWPFKEERGRKRGMGTTVVGALFTSTGAYVGHCGDSRAYRFRNGQIEQLTEDHSLLNDYLKAHKLTQEEIDNFPHKNVIVRALGMKDTVQVDIARLEPAPGDIYMLCSDGLSGMVSDEAMNAAVNEFLAAGGDRADDVEGICSTLIDMANANGGNDNVTCVAIKVVD